MTALSVRCHYMGTSTSWRRRTHTASTASRQTTPTTARCASWSLAAPARYFLKSVRRSSSIQSSSLTQPSSLCRICPTRTATGTAIASSASSAADPWSAGPLPPRMTCSCAPTATATSTLPSATHAWRPSCQVNNQRQKSHSNRLLRNHQIPLSQPEHDWAYNMRCINNNSYCITVKLMIIGWVMQGKAFMWSCLGTPSLFWNWTLVLTCRQNWICQHENGFSWSPSHCLSFTPSAHQALKRWNIRATVGMRTASLATIASSPSARGTLSRRTSTTTACAAMRSSLLCSASTARRYCNTHSACLSYKQRGILPSRRRNFYLQGESWCHCTSKSSLIVSLSGGDILGL